MSQIARHFRTADDQKRSICPKMSAALSWAKPTLTMRCAKGFSRDAEIPCVPNWSLPRCILPRISHFSQNRGSDWQYRGIPSPLNIGEGRPQKEVARFRTAPAISWVLTSAVLPLCFVSVQVGPVQPEHSRIGFKGCPLPSLAVAFSSCSPVRRRAFGVFRTWVPILGGRQGERFPFHINRDLSYFFFYRIYIVTVLSGAFPSLLGIVWRVSAAFLGDAVLNGTVRGMLWRACPSLKGKNHPF